ncbi:MAG: ATP-binding cassette domain-containing protein [candidate division Zixibacteria bacterium]|nr:ATP-binding cassette domain-containing protein [Candidatus Tariuqbacter arcticus]
MEESNPTIEVKNLTVQYGDNLVLDDISFEVFPGEIFVILGESGCGKTTILKHMTGLRKPEAGSILIDGEDIITADGADHDRILKKFGVLFQSGALLGSMTLGDNVALPLRESTGLPREVIDEMVRMKLSIVGLENKEHLLPSELSGGMRKRGGLARAIALDPQILFFDEPSAGLDPVTQVGLDELILGLNAHLGTTMVVVTHELQSIFKIAQRVIMLDTESGKIIAEGVPAELRESSDNPRVRAFFRRELIKQ